MKRSKASSRTCWPCSFSTKGERRARGASAVAFAGSGQPGGGPLAAAAGIGQFEVGPGAP